MTFLKIISSGVRRTENSVEGSEDKKRLAPIPYKTIFTTCHLVQHLDIVS